MSKQEILPAVSAYIVNERGEVLLQKRKDTGKWCIISGHAEFGETVQHAMEREVMEETGVPSRVKRLIGVYSSPPYATYYYRDRTVQYVVTYFEVTLLGPVPEKIVNPETEALAYFAPDNLPEDFDQINPHWLADAMGQRDEAFIR